MLRKIVDLYNKKRLDKNIKKHKVNVRKKHNGNDITIISNNCIAGVIYNILGMKFFHPQ